MLSDEEEKARALKVSKLYLTPLKRKTNATSWTETFSFKTTITAAFLFSIPLIFANSLYDVYFLSSYTNLADIQAASMIFIVLLMAVFACFVFCFKASYNAVYNRYAAGRAIFLLSLIISVSVIPFVRVLTTGAAGQEFIELIIRCSAFAGACILISTGIFTIVTKFVLHFSSSR